MYQLTQNLFRALMMARDLSMAGTERVSREEILSMISSAVLSEYYCIAAFELAAAVGEDR